MLRKKLKFLYTIPLVFFSFFSFNIPTVFADTLLSDNFDSYTVGGLDTQGSWVHFSGTGSSDMQVSTIQSSSGSNSITAENSATAGFTRIPLPSSTTSFNLTARIYGNTASTADIAFGKLSIGLSTGTANPVTFLTFLGNGTQSLNHGFSTCTVPLSTGTVPFITNAWNNISISVMFDGTDSHISFTVNSDTYSTSCTGSKTYTNLTIGSSNNHSTWDGDIFVDSIAVSDDINGVFPYTPTGLSANPVSFNGSYHNNSSYNKLVFQVDDLTNSQTFAYERNIPLVNGFNLSYSYSIPLSLNRDYQYRVKLYDSVNNISSDWSDFIDFEIANGVVSSPEIDDEVCTPIEVLGYPVADFACELRNALKWAFIPSNNSLQQFQNLTLRNSEPFSYVYDVGILWDEMFNADSSMNLGVTADTPLGEITFINASMVESIPYTSLIKTLLGYIMYFFTAMYLYRFILNKTHSK